jgi:hypothetical protein
MRKKAEANPQPKSSTSNLAALIPNLLEGEGERSPLCALGHRILSCAAIEWWHERGTKNRN